MGIFNSVNHTHAPEAPAEPRFGHYFMAHYALRTVALRHPFELVAKLTSPRGYDFLARLLDEVAEVCRDEGSPPPDYTAADLHIHRRCVGTHACTVVRFPEPKATGEAYMVAIVVRGDRPAATRYFTLEKGMARRRGAEPTAIGEWTGTSQLNAGDGPPDPSVHAFLVAIEERIRSSPSTAAAAAPQ